MSVRFMCDTQLARTTTRGARTRGARSTRQDLHRCVSDARSPHLHMPEGLLGMSKQMGTIACARKTNTGRALSSSEQCDRFPSEGRPSLSPVPYLGCELSRDREARWRSVRCHVGVHRDLGSMILPCLMQASNPPVASTPMSQLSTAVADDALCACALSSTSCIRTS